MAVAMLTKASYETRRLVRRGIHGMSKAR
jgi:hypothetical protein